MHIKVLGKGCKKCHLLEDHVKKAVNELGITATIEHITDLDEMLELGVIQTPALIIDGQIKVSGRVLTVKKIKSIIQ